MDSQPRHGRSGHTRRAFIRRSGLMGGAAWLAVSGWDKTIGRAVAAILPSAEARRRSTYVALVDAAAASERNGVAAAAAAEVTSRYEAWYAAQPDGVRRIADSTLDDLDSAYADGPFHKADRDRRLEFLRERAYGPYRDRPATPGMGEERAGARRISQIRENAAKPEYRADPTDFSTARGVPIDRSARPIPEPVHTDADVRRAALVEAALMLVAAPLVTPLPFDPEDLTKVDLVAV